MIIIISDPNKISEFCSYFMVFQGTVERTMWNEKMTTKCCLLVIECYCSCLLSYFQGIPKIMDLFSLYVLFSHFRPRDVPKGKKLFPGVTSRGLKWENKTCKLKRSIGETNDINSNQIKYCFLWRGKNRSIGRKTSRSRAENQQTQPTYESGNRTRAKLVWGECSHHYPCTPMLQCCSPVLHCTSTALKSPPAPFSPLRQPCSSFLKISSQLIRLSEFWSLHVRIYLLYNQGKSSLGKPVKLHIQVQS